MGYIHSSDQAAEHAARASAELKVLNDAQWYVGALSTWCAAALTCSKNGDTISASI